MTLKAERMILVCLMMTGLSGAWADNASRSIVPEDGRISDNRARLALVNALLRVPDGRQEALAQLRLLQAPAVSEPELLRELADSYAALGHCQAVLALSKQEQAENKKTTGIFAEHALLWGDFYGAEHHWRQVLTRYPECTAAQTRLALTLVEAERYCEAEVLYRSLWLKPPHAPAAALALVRVYLLQKRFLQAETLARELLGVPSMSRPATQLLGEALQAQNKLEEAEALFAGRTQKGDATAEEWTRLGVVQLRLDEKQRAEASFDAALKQDPAHIEAAFRRMGRETVASDDVIKALFARESHPERLRQWALLYAQENFYPQALACYARALDLDPDYFPAAEGQAFVLAISGNHAEAEKQYRALIARFPESAKLQVGLARTLAWARAYDTAREVYDRLINNHAHDITLQREAARVALWAKDFDESMARYDRILKPSAEEQSKRLNGCLELQQAIAHERAYKRLLFRHRYLHALREVNELITREPGDQEALFDRAQIRCMLGLCDCARADYQHLLLINNMHAIATEALELARLDAHPSLKLSGSYWREEGRGELSDVQRYTTALEANIPISCRAALFAETRRWFELPGDYDGRIDAWSHTLGFRGTFTSFLKGEMNWTYKQYEQSRYTGTHTGQAKLWANLNDYAQLGAGYGRADELYNRFGYMQKTQSDTSWVELKSDLTRRWDAALRLREIEYSDDNHGRSIFLNTGFDMTDHPRILKLSASAEYRDTQNPNQYIYDGANRLVNIIHPYWAPQDYVAGFLTLEWWHDLSVPHQYCGNRRHFYDLKASLGMDTEENPGITLEAEWQYRFTQRWFIGLNAYAHYSEDWNAQGLWVSLGCHL